MQPPSSNKLVAPGNLKRPREPSFGGWERTLPDPKLAPVHLGRKQRSPVCSIFMSWAASLASPA